MAAYSLKLKLGILLPMGMDGNPSGPSRKVSEVQN